MRVSEVMEVHEIRIERVTHLGQGSHPALHQCRVAGWPDLVEDPIRYAGLVFVTRVKRHVPRIRYGILTPPESLPRRGVVDGGQGDARIEHLRVVLGIAVEQRSGQEMHVVPQIH